ncbi:hypothetical protein [Priestia megaterium]|uniref:hypothetical protein n=1 Tax=Priestia megaterium TaxID=1404 RepID=UPI003644512F
MRTNQIIEDLKVKALNGDVEAKREYTEYVNRGLAPRLNGYVSADEIQSSLNKMMAGYQATAEARGDDLFISKPRELTEEEVMKADPVTKIGYGYGQRAEAVAERKEKRREYMRNLDKKQESYNQ